METNPFGEPNISSSSKKFRVLHEIRRFITAFTTACSSSLPLRHINLAQTFPSNFCKIRFSIIQPSTHTYVFLVTPHAFCLIRLPHYISYVLQPQYLILSQINSAGINAATFLQLYVLMYLSIADKVCFTHKNFVRKWKNCYFSFHSQ